MSSWQEIGLQKRTLRDNLIPEAWRFEKKDYPSGSSVLHVPETCGILSVEEIEITSKYDAVDIVGLIKDGTYSAEAVTTAFCKRAAIAQQLVNCLTEIFFVEAIDRAKKLDEAHKANPDTPLRPLHGLPISLKDSFKIPGIDSTIGYISLVNKPAEKAAPLVQILLDLGAVLYCKTNIPQTMMTADSDNNVFGRTLNPNNTSLTAGGSTGGEGALIALRGSILGVGTDIGGSVRIPSMSNGIYGIKPTSTVLPYSGQQSPGAPGSAAFSASAGPMATSMRACRFLLQTVVGAEPWKFDFGCDKLPWAGIGPEIGGSKLRVGYAEDDGNFTVWPPMARALKSSVEKLEAAGVTVVPISLPIVKEITENSISYFLLDGGKHTTAIFASTGEPPIASVAGFGAPSGVHTSLENLMKFNVLRTEHRQLYNNFWRETNLDCIILAPAPHPAAKLDQWKIINYLVPWNYLDYPASIIPVGRVEAGDVPGKAKYGAEDEALYAAYTGPEDWKNAPISIQVVGRRQHDEELSNVASYIDSILNGN